jgi:hypothetical protein
MIMPSVSQEKRWPYSKDTKPFNQFEDFNGQSRLNALKG